MIRPVDLTVWVILEDLKSSLPEGTQVQCGFRCAGTQCSRRIPAPGRSSEEGYLRWDAVQKKDTCAGTQCRRRIPASARRSEEAKVRPHSESTRRDSVSGCVPAVKVRGAIVSLGASLQ